MPDAVEAVLDGCASGRLSPAMAAMRLLMEADSPAGARAALDRALAASPAAPLRSLAELLDRNPDAWTKVRGVVGAVEHEAPEGDPVAHWARLFDRAVSVSPEGSVALYSLGSPDLLARATGEIVAFLRAESFIDGGTHVLDVGCGIGRVAAALSPHVAAVTGLDISPGMIDEARRRCAGLPNLAFAVGSGRDLADVPDEAVDLVLFVDSFPYLVLSGDELACRHVAETARVLRPGGRAVILNLSYRDSPGADDADLARFAGLAGLRVLDGQRHPFPTWDAAAFRLGKA